MRHPKVVKGVKGPPRGSKVDIRGDNQLLWSRVLIIGATLNDSQAFDKSGGLRGTSRWLKGTQEAPRGSKVGIGGANEHLWPRGLIIGAKLDASWAFGKSGGLRGHFKVV